MRHPPAPPSLPTSVRAARALPLLALTVAVAWVAAGCAFIAQGADKGAGQDPVVDALHGGGADGALEGADAGDLPADATPTADGSARSDKAAQIPPQGAGPLTAWLKAGHYSAWSRESKAHKSSGPHGQTRVFVNDTLVLSLSKGMASHPLHAATVKELFAEDLKTRIGWSVSLKVQADSAGGEGWYWFESLDKGSGPTVLADGLGTAMCVDCHKKGNDQVLTGWPLQ